MKILKVSSLVTATLVSLASLWGHRVLASPPVVPMKVSRESDQQKDAWTEPRALAADFLHGEMFVLDKYAIFVYPLRSEGEAAPLRVIHLDRNNLRDLVYDAKHDELLVLTSAGVSTYARTAQSHPQPLRSLSCDGLTWSFCLRLDSTRDQILVGGRPVKKNGFPEIKGSFIRAFSRLGHGEQRPLRELRLPHGKGSFDYNAKGDQLWVDASDNVQVGLEVYPGNAATGTKPKRGLWFGEPFRDRILRVLVDSAHNEIFAGGLSENTWSFDVYSTRPSNTKLRALRQLSSDAANGISGIV